MALQTQLEEARAKLTKAEADFETPRGLVQYVVAAYRQEFEEAGELEGVIDLVRHAFVTLAERSKEISGLKERLKQSERTRDILVRQCDAAQGERNGISERQDQSRALCEDLEASLKTATANANQILENLGRVTRQRDELGSEVQRLLTLIPESDPRRDPNWKPEEAPPVGEIPQWVKDAKAAEHHSLLTDEERARGKALVEASARLAGVNPAIAEACERVAANVPAKPKASQRVVVLESAVRYGHFRPGTVGLISADQTSTPRGWVCVEFDDGRLTQNVPAEHLAFVQEAQP
jgi:chromosome segregation ATPase